MTLWRIPAFRKLWLANTVSSLGAQITYLALPLTAITLLHASPGQMGILTASATLPYLLLGLPAGVWVDRLRRRPILIAADGGRAILLGLISLLAVLKCLRIEHLYIWSVHSALLFSCSGVFLGILWVWFSPLRMLYLFNDNVSGDVAVVKD